MSTDGLFQIAFKKLSNEIRCKDPNATYAKEFQLLESNYERVNFLIECPLFHNILSVGPSNTHKDPDKAALLKNAGNKEFQKKNHAAALLAYNRALRFVPTMSDDNLLAICYANRSAVLYHMERYEACLDDIKRAIKTGYPKENLYKLLTRKAKCYQYLELERREKSVKEALDALTLSGLSDEKREVWHKELDNLKYCVEVDQSTNKTNELPYIQSRNEKFGALSSAVSVSENGEYGRYLQASSEILTGENMLLEKPYCSVTVPGYYLSHCCHCQTRVAALLLPCDYCADVIYCSVVCKSQSWDLYHRFECANMLNLKNANVNMGHLALRSACQAGVSTLKDLLGGSVTTAQSADSDGYFNVYDLEGHEQERSPKDLFWRSCAAVFLASMCDIDEWSEGDADGLAVLATFVLRHMMSFPCNAHEISELSYDTKLPYQSELLEVGAGIYPTLSLTNHSCDPNVVRTFHKGNVCVLKALAPIAQYEQVFDNYGCLYAVHNLQDRRAKLKAQYCFECCCFACLQNWPFYKEMDYKSEPMYKCQACCSIIVASGCGKCNHKFDKQATDSILSRARDAFTNELSKLFSGHVEDSQLEEVSRKLQNYSNLTNRLVFRPYKSLNDCQEALKHVYNMLGNRSIASPS